MSVTRLAPPAAFHPDIPRPGVYARLQSALHRQILALLSPGGFGKTCALRGFWPQLAGNKAWLDVRGAGDDFATHWQAALAQVADGGLIVIDGIEDLRPEYGRELATALEQAPRELRFILCGRHGKALPLAEWRAQGRLSSLDATALALREEEWREFGLPGSARDWGGWWGAMQAASRPELAWEADFAAWLDSAWLSDLDAAQLADLGLAALLPTLEDEDFAALGGRRECAELGHEAGPLCISTTPLRLVPRFRPYLLEAWRKQAPETVKMTLDRGFSRLLARGRAAQAVWLLDAADPQQAEAAARQILAAAGWQLLFSRHRDLLKRALDVAPADTTLDLLSAAWRLEACKRPHEAEAILTGLGVSTDPVVQAITCALRASIAHQSDAFELALTYARQARALFGDRPHPAAFLAELIEAASLLTSGELNEAEACLSHVSACAARDRLEYLQLAALHRRASAAAEADNLEAALNLITARHSEALACELNSPEILDATARLEASLETRRLQLAAARRALDRGRDTAERYGDYWQVPYLTLEAIAHLIEGQGLDARATVLKLERQLTERFICHKWRADALLPQIWLRALENDNAGLLGLAEKNLKADWPTSIFLDRRYLYCQAARFLAGAEMNLAELRNIATRRTAQACLELGHFTERLLALAEGAPDGLLHALKVSARQDCLLDWLWLMPKALPALEPLLNTRAMANEDQTRDFLRRLLARALPASEQRIAVTAPPSGLTQKEWLVLLAIGEQLSNEQIAARLHVSLATIKTHINHIYAKLQLSSRSEAIQRARALQNFPPRPPLSTL